MPKPKEEYFNSEMEHFESLRNGINNPPTLPSMSQQSTQSKASDTTADTNDMDNLRQVIPGSQQVVGKGLSQLSEGSDGDDINDAMFSQQSNEDNDNSADRNARRLGWAQKVERSAAEESNNPIEKMRAAVWSKVEDAPTTNNTNKSTPNNSTPNNNNNSTTPSWADRISSSTKNVLVNNNTTSDEIDKIVNEANTGDLGDLASPPPTTTKKNIQNVNEKMSSLIGGREEEEVDGEGISPANWAPINSSEEQGTTTTGHIVPRWAMARDEQTNRDLYGSGARYVGAEAWMNDINSDINSRHDDDLIDPSNPPGRDKMLSMFDNTANDNDNSSSTSSGLPGDSPEGDNLVSTGKDVRNTYLYASRCINLTYPSLFIHPPLNSCRATACHHYPESPAHPVKLMKTAAPWLLVMKITTPHSTMLNPN